MRESVITSVEKQKKKPERYNIYVDGEYAFSVHEDVMVKFQLFKNRNINTSEMQLVLDEEERNCCRLQAIKYLGFRPRTRWELEQYLFQKGYDEQIVRDTVEWCADKSYVNDERYARQWVEERMANRPRGRHLLMREMQQRGIDPHVAEIALHGVAGEDEKEAAIYLLRKKFKPGSFADFKTFLYKAGGYLQRKGFDHTITRQAINSIKNEFLESDRVEE